MKLNANCTSIHSSFKIKLNTVNTTAMSARPGMQLHYSWTTLKQGSTDDQILTWFISLWGFAI